MPLKYNYEFGNGSDPGCVRPENEDKYILLEAGDKRQKAFKGNLMLICDGMGGARGGKVASSLAVEEIANTYYRHSSQNIPLALVESIKAANAKIYQHGKAHEHLEGMGTTVVAVVIKDEKAYIAHVGDSRCYHLRNHKIKLMTEDHTVVQRMVNEGMISEAEARQHPDSHILNRCVGVHPEMEVDLLMNPIAMRPGDVLLLTSDGLHGMVFEDEILQIVMSNPAQNAADKLIELARERGGPDNITVQIARYLGEEPAVNIGTTTIRTAPLRKKSRVLKILTILMILVILAGAVAWALWFFEIVDFRSLLNVDWIPYPP